MDERLNVNRARWDELVPIHMRSRFYDLESFEAGRCSLRPLELRALGEVRGKSLLHLQCHFGQDTLSWARRGAIVTGVDFSPVAIEAARALAHRIAVEGRFVLSDVLRLREVLNEQFDVVFTSYGVVGWLPDIGAWGRVVAASLKPGGRFFLAEVHPAILMFEWDDSTQGMKLASPYFGGAEPLYGEFESSYADAGAKLVNRGEYWFVHTLGDVVNALIEAGLTIEALHEHPFGICSLLPGSKQAEDGWWYLPEGSIAVPQLYSILARR
ncbi:MAG: methyltransferase domain-containing protein [Acidobacteriota bacterium]